ncbi:Thioredoxin-like [Sphingobacterium nematocida]|uniref:Thioredoxin-like n=1 Tax=Sphingobacterium nematocida TaxID=1513896 RepID=A0A1T5DEV1_9SPHI|nr:thioredoxin family protein [Sphingobacterium nematocida]SKB70278.1 Thioredoxin-like [Sphingobacterium nematocida]
MLNKLKLLIVLFCCPIMLLGQQPVEVLTSYKEGLAEAKKNNRLLFIDFYTDWCLPCKVMDKEVFTDPKVQDMMRKRFVFVKINAEKGEGVQLAKSNKVTGYPTFVMQDASGTEVHRVVGSSSVALFIESVEKGLDKDRSEERIVERYKKGERSAQLVNDYAFSIMKSDNETEGFAVIDAYYKSLSDAKRVLPENWYIFERYTQKATDTRISDLLKRQDAYRKSVGEQTVNSYLTRMLRVEIMPYVNGNLTADAQKIAHAKTFAQQAQIKDLPEVSPLLTILDARLAYGRTLPALQVLKSTFPKLREADRFIIMLGFKADKTIDSLVINDIQEELMVNYIPAQSEYNQKMLTRILGDIQKVKMKDGVDFKTIPLFQALQQAANDRKLVFLDAYTDWCGPCKEMDRSVFPLPKVGSYINDKFLALKVNAEKGEGVEIRKKYAINAYPTYLILDLQGKELHRIVGFMSGDELIQKLESGLKSTPLADLIKTYQDKSARTPDLIDQLAKGYFEAGQRGRGEMLVDSLFKTLSSTQRLSKEYAFVYKYAQSTKSERMQFFMTNHAQFTKNLGWYDFQELVDSVFPKIVMNYQAQFRQPRFLDEQFPLLESFQLNASSETKNLLQLVRLSEKEDMDGVLEFLDKNLVKFKGKNRVFASYRALSVPNKGTAEQNRLLKKILDNILSVETDQMNIEAFTMFRDRIPADSLQKG